MDFQKDQEECSLDVVKITTNVEATEETCSAQIQVNNEEVNAIPFADNDVSQWQTSFIGQICREGDVQRFRLLIDFNRQTTSCAKLMSERLDRLDTDTGLSPLHHAARHRQLQICIMLLSNIQLHLGVNIKDEDGRTPIHSAFRSSMLNSSQRNHLVVESDFGDQIQTPETWYDDYKNNILMSDHPIVYLFAKVNGNINARDKYLLTPLHYAITNQNLAGVKQLIKLNADIEAEDRQGIRPMHLACSTGILPIVEYLFDSGARIDSIDADGWTPLHHACTKGHLDIIQLIGSKEISTFAELILPKTKSDSTCLHLAVQNGNNELVEHILGKLTTENRRKVLADHAKSLGTPLHIAAKFCDSSMIRLLCDHDADPSIINSNGESPLHIACAANRLPIVEELHRIVQTSLLELKDKHGRTALSLTTNPEVLDRLILYGADISSLDKKHMNSFMIAVSTSQIAIVNRFLTRHKHSLPSIINQTDKVYDRSVFLIAAQTGSVDMCSLLLTEPSIRWDTTDKQRLNAFHIAAQTNNPQLIALLCKHIEESTKSLRKISHNNLPATTSNSSQTNPHQAVASLHFYIDAQNEDGETPLHIASEQGHISCVEALLNNRANILLANHLGHLPLHSAIQNGHYLCVELLIKVSTNGSSEFQSVLSRKQSPLITACQNGFVDIVKLLITENIGIHDNTHFDYESDENLLEIAIKCRHGEIVHVLLEHPLCEYWLSAQQKSTTTNDRQTPMRDLIRHMPDCAEHAFDKLILKTHRMDSNGNIIQQTNYKYKFFDDYFVNGNQLYSTSSNQMYNHHPLIIALNQSHHHLLEHPLVKQLIYRKWKLYRPFFYFPRVLSALLLLFLTFYVLVTFAPSMSTPTESVSKMIQLSATAEYIIQWIIIILSVINVSKILIEIILFRGLRVPIAQCFGLLSFCSSIIPFIPHGNSNIDLVYWQWQVLSFSVLFQWFNIAVIFRSLPFVGFFFVMIESVLKSFADILFVVLPLLISFMISTKMIFFNQPAFATVPKSIHKSTSMLVGEFDYETLFFSKETFPAASLIFIPFIVIICIVFVNLLLGITIGDIKASTKHAQEKANAYWIRELIYIESTLPSNTWLRYNVIEDEIVYYGSQESIRSKRNERKEQKILLSQSYVIELQKLVDILDMLCTQAKQVLEYQNHLEKKLQQLLMARKGQSSGGSTSGR